MKSFFIPTFIICAYSSFAQSSDVLKDIQGIADASACRSVSFSHNQGIAPRAYTRGMAVTFGKSLCRGVNSQDPYYDVMAKAPSGSLDALFLFESSFHSAHVSIEAGAPALRALYTLEMDHGMMESSGNYSEGWDHGNKRLRNPNVSMANKSIEAESGLFQTSYDGLVSDIQKNLYKEYLDDPSKCHLDIFSAGIKNKNVAAMGFGEGKKFQEFEKTCPAFATELAMLSVRILASHFGPIITKVDSKRVHVRQMCEPLFQTVQGYIEQNPRAICPHL